MNLEYNDTDNISGGMTPKYTIFAFFFSVCIGFEKVDEKIKFFCNILILILKVAY